MAPIRACSVGKKKTVLAILWRESGISNQIFEEADLKEVLRLMWKYGVIYHGLMELDVECPGSILPCVRK